MGKDGHSTTKETQDTSENIYFMMAVYFLRPMQQLTEDQAEKWYFFR